MNLRSLSYFVAVAEELNISRAAEKLNMSQPPLSTQIKNLEYDLNTTLFVRGKRQLMLTESGQLLYRRAKEIINLADKAEEEILALTKGLSGTITIGLTEGMSPDIVAEWISGFMKEHSKVRFRILDGNSDDLTEKLLSGIVSLAFITAPCNQSLLNSFPVGNEKMTVIMKKDHPLALSCKTSLDITDIVGEPLIVSSRKADIDTIYKWFRSTKNEPYIVCEMDSSLNATALAARGIGICVFPKTAFINNDSLVSIDIDIKANNVEYLFVWRKGHPLPTIEESFIDYIKDIAIQK
ncbi:MAG: LysR family transcriptional regulator [Lachnospiraceae bacterium]|nr:LysR family transcriptional regulator [Lachnospiraceae bacterium]